MSSKSSAGAMGGQLPTWITNIPGLKFQRNYYRQFSDGVMFAKVIHHYRQEFVSLPTYRPASSTALKKQNLELLSSNVLLSKLKIDLSKNDIEKIAEGHPETIDSVLLAIGKKLGTTGEPEDGEDEKVLSIQKTQGTKPETTAKPLTFSTAGKKLGRQENTRTSAKKPVTGIPRLTSTKTVDKTTRPSPAKDGIGISGPTSTKAGTGIPSPTSTTSAANRRKGAARILTIGTTSFSAELQPTTSASTVEAKSSGESVTKQMSTEEVVQDWLKDVPLSRETEEDFGRSFSDGKLVAELIAFFQPGWIDLSEYSESYSLRHKKTNWEKLSCTVLLKLDLALEESQILEFCNGNAPLIQEFLKKLKPVLTEKAEEFSPKFVKAEVDPKPEDDSEPDVDPEPVDTDAVPTSNANEASGSDPESKASGEDDFVDFHEALAEYNDEDPLADFDDDPLDSEAEADDEGDFEYDSD